jgi:hypothetical protein
VTAATSMPADVRQLLVTVLDALTIPFPATSGDHARYAEILEQRAMFAVVALRRTLATHQPSSIVDLGWETAWLRERLSECRPAGYKTLPWPGVPVDAGSAVEGGGRA